MKYSQYVMGSSLFKLTLLSISFAAGFGAGGPIPWQEQSVLYDMLRNLVLMLFGVIGAWFAVLYPLTVGERRNDKIQILAKGLFPALRVLIYLLCILTLMPPTVVLLKRFGPYAFTVTCTLRSLSLGTLLCMVLCLLHSLLLTLVPFDDFKKQVDAATARDKITDAYQQQKIPPKKD